MKTTQAKEMRQKTETEVSVFLERITIRFKRSGVEMDKKIRGIEYERGEMDSFFRFAF